MNISLKSCIAESVGTFTLCFIGAGAIIMDSHTGGGVGLVGIALAHGLALSVAVSATMNVSGGQINPAITLGLMSIGKEKPGQGVANIVSQLIGGAIGGLLLTLLFPGGAVEAAKVGTPVLAEGIGSGKGIAIEAIGTFLLAMAVFGTAVGSKAPKGMAGFGIGLTLSFVILAIGPLTGAALNPARHFGTAIFAGEFAPMVVYWIGPAVGAIISFQLCSRILEGNK